MLWIGRLDGSATLDAASAAIGHGLALTAAEFRVLAFVSLVEVYIHANRQHPTFLAPDPLTDSCPTDPATHFGVCVEAATTAPHNELSSPLALVSTPWPAVARRPTTTSRRQTTLLALQLSAVPPPVAHGRSHRLLCLTISAQLFRSNIFDVEIYLIVLLSVLIFSKTTGACAGCILLQIMSVPQPA